MASNFWLGWLVWPSAAVCCLLSTEGVSLRFADCTLLAVGWRSLAGDRRCFVLAPYSSELGSVTSQLALELPPTARYRDIRVNRRSSNGSEPHGVGQPPCYWARASSLPSLPSLPSPTLACDDGRHTRRLVRIHTRTVSRTISEHPSTLCVAFPFDTDIRSIEVPRRQPANTVVVPQYSGTVHLISAIHSISRAFISRQNVPPRYTAGGYYWRPLTGAASYSPGIVLELNTALCTKVSTYNAAEGGGRCHWSGLWIVPLAVTSGGLNKT